MYMVSFVILTIGIRVLIPYRGLPLHVVCQLVSLSCQHLDQNTNITFITLCNLELVVKNRYFTDRQLEEAMQQFPVQV